MLNSLTYLCAIVPDRVRPREEISKILLSLCVIDVLYVSSRSLEPTKLVHYSIFSNWESVLGSVLQCLENTIDCVVWESNL